MSIQIGKFKRTGILPMFLFYISIFGLVKAIKLVWRRLVLGHWSIYIDQMATSVSVATTLSAMTGSPYAPLLDGRLRQVILTVAGDAVTSLIEAGHVAIASVTFGGIEIHVPFAGANIRTAPAFPVPITIVDCDVPVRSAKNLTIEIINETGATPVTPRFAVYGVFEGSA